VNSVNDDGLTPLMYAVKNESMDIAKWLIKNGADVKARDEERNSILTHACENPNATAEFIASLIKAGLDVNEANTSGRTPFMAAASAIPSASIVESLLKAGGKVNAADEYGTTPLMGACSDNSETAVIELLIKAGAAVNVADDANYTPLLYSLYNENASEIAPILLNAGAKARVTGNDGANPLIMAAWYGRMDLLKTFLDAGVAINAIDDEGKTALMYACEETDSPDPIDFLVKAGADASIVDESGKSAYDYASDNSSISDNEDLLTLLKGPLKAL
jgi:ankyrin repeat protein